MHRGLPSPEFQGHRRAVLLGAAIDPTPAALAELRALAPGLDWHAAVELASRLGVAPLLHRTVKRAGIDVPEDARRRLMAGFALVGVRNDAVMAEVLRVTRALDDAGIPSLPLKGASLMGTLYPDPALRPVSDIDLLVPSAQARAAGRVLVSLGYAHHDRGLLLERSELFHHHVVFSRDARPFPFHLELHHRLLTSYLRRQESDATLGRGTRVPFASSEIRRLQPEDELIYLAAHAAVHVAEPHLKWLVDLAELLERTTIDWDVVALRARASGAATGAYESLRRLEPILGVAAPPTALRRLKPAAPVRAAFARLAPLTVAFGDHLPGKWPQLALGLLLQEGVVDRMLYAGSAVGYKVWLERARRSSIRAPHS